jgi:hypothetical protein
VSGCCFIPGSLGRPTALAADSLLMEHWDHLEKLLGEL